MQSNKLVNKNLSALDKLLVFSLKSKENSRSLAKIRFVDKKRMQWITLIEDRSHWLVIILKGPERKVEMDYL